MTTLPSLRPPHGRWQQGNVWAGYLVFGFPAVAAIPALASTISRFGLRDSLLNAGPAALTACLPLLLWARYTRRRPGTYTGKVTWFVVGLAGLAALAFSPLFFWAGPAMLVLLSEILRLITAPALAFASNRVRAGRRALSSRSNW
ncbi:hypothetical protein [Nostocoides sp. F2B08]|uniref:hypothetical protein n=1 Tax=Nostocoides sp. F2B08 TaxID=2653936 RepID=UPI00186B5860|nr:hypothetical protein [Tetrasphaera sp. F2B08]